MPDDTRILGLPLIQPSQAQKHVTHNEALRLLDVLVQAVAVSRGADVPPAAPLDGDCHLVGAAPTGDWAGQPQAIALRENGGWQFLTARRGWHVWVIADQALARFDGAAWRSVAADDLRAATVGVNAAPDAVNRLTVAAPASLLTYDAAGGHQLKINKAAPSDTASLLFQTGYAGRAEMGTAGSDDFAVKVSVDGAAFVEALRVAAATGVVHAPQGLMVTGALTGTAVTQSAADATPGRLVRTGDFGLGAAAAPSISDANAATVGGTWLVPAGGTVGNLPSGFGTGVGVLQVMPCDSGGNVVQIVSRTDSQMWRRSRAGGTWSGWQRLFNAGNVLGPVSQAAGVPTGALIESGSNANGTYRRFACGLQICTRTDLSVANVATTHGALFRSPDAAWTFPAAFTSGTAPAVSGGCDDADAWLTCATPSQTAVTLRAQSAVTKAAAVGLRAIAIGRWF